LTIAVINYNGRDVLPGTLAAIDRLRDAGTKVVVIDDASTDGSDQWVAEHYPAFHLHRMPNNNGKPSHLRNKALELATTRFVLLLDHDVMLTKACVLRLLQAMNAHPGPFCCTPRLMDAQAPHRLYLDGGGVHFLGISSRLGRGLAASQRRPTAPIHAIGGGNLMVDRVHALAMGGFDTDYLFGWGEDAELPMRARIAGFATQHVPSACAWHTQRQHGTTRAEAQLYNRLRLILTQYHARTLCLISPVLIGAELLLGPIMIGRGLAKAYGNAWRRIWHTRRAIVDTRRQIQHTRRVGDGAVLEGSTMAMVDHPQTGFFTRGLMSTINTALSMYWRLVRPWLWQGDQTGIMRPRKATHRQGGGGELSGLGRATHKGAGNYRRSTGQEYVGRQVPGDVESQHP
jgi:GT2 family glycosyltransferase